MFEVEVICIPIDVILCNLTNFVYAEPFPQKCFEVLFDMNMKQGL